MKKLTRKSLDELARVMPVVDELKKRNYVGGTWYFDKAGVQVAYIDDGSQEIRIGTPESSIAFSSTSMDVVAKVMNTMGASIGVNGSIIVDNKYGNGVYGYTDPSSGKISINMTSPSFEGSNYCDFLSTLHHEHYHQMNIGNGLSYDENELQALIYEMSQPSFKNASQEYKAETLKVYDRYYKKIYGDSGNYSGSGNYGDSGNIYYA